MNKAIYICKPEDVESAYAVATEEFVSYWQRITGEAVSVLDDSHPLPECGRVIVIGSASVNNLSKKLVGNGLVELPEENEDTDEYVLKSCSYQGCELLCIAGSCGRSTLYAVYDLFHRCAGVRYFWDGDIVPCRQEIDIDGLYITERPRFQYRGIRYFAHRGLHRFQAEHWNFDDWKREIDWLLKKRLNLFMLRIGFDDLFQRAFPDVVDYPPVDGIDPDAEPRSYNDRTSFWPLKMRGELRQKVLHYASERGLLHPEDAGTITHWYSRTPSSLLQSENIKFTRQNGGSYTNPTGLVWDIEDPATWKRYWKLTDTHIKHFGSETPSFFHTIGLAERLYSEDAEENRKIKTKALHRIEDMIREHYPDTPLLLASWDFLQNWRKEDVKKLFNSLDPDRVILLDYTSDVVSPVNNVFTEWGVMSKFPWFVGIFQGLAPNTDLRGDFSHFEKRFDLAVKDPACKGMVYWSEFSHGDAFTLEYFTSLAWEGGRATMPILLDRFCRERYPAESFTAMKKAWERTLEVSQTRNWSHDLVHPMREMNGLIFFNILTSPWLTKINDDVLEAIDFYSESLNKILNTVPELFPVLERCLPYCNDNEFIRRDIIDLVRTIFSRLLHALLLQAAKEIDLWNKGKYPADSIRMKVSLCRKLLVLLGKTLFQHEDFSLYLSLERLKQTSAINPHSEQTLKGNVENGYCRSFFAELFESVYLPEFDLYAEWVNKKLDTEDRSPWILPEDYLQRQNTIRDAFYAIPLQEMYNGALAGESLQEILAQAEESIQALQPTVSNCS